MSRLDVLPWPVVVDEDVLDVGVVSCGGALSRKSLRMLVRACSGVDVFKSVLKYKLQAHWMLELAALKDMLANVGSTRGPSLSFKDASNCSFSTRLKRSYPEPMLVCILLRFSFNMWPLFSLWQCSDSNNFIRK